jgi:hypothetical protein
MNSSRGERLGRVLAHTGRLEMCKTDSIVVGLPDSGRILKLWICQMFRQNHARTGKVLRGSVAKQGHFDTNVVMD